MNTVTIEQLSLGMLILGQSDMLSVCEEAEVSEGVTGARTSLML